MGKHRVFALLRRLEGVSRVNHVGRASNLVYPDTLFSLLRPLINLKTLFYCYNYMPPYSTCKGELQVLFEFRSES